jgi:hypothetical protein
MEKCFANIIPEAQIIHILYRRQIIHTLETILPRN